MTSILDWLSWKVTSIFYDRYLTMCVALCSYGVYLVYVIASTMAFCACREHYLLRKHNVSLVVVAAIFNVLATMSLFCQFLFPDQGFLRRLLSLGSVTVIYPLFMLCIVHGRCLHLIFSHRWAAFLSSPNDDCVAEDVPKTSSRRWGALQWHRHGVVLFLTGALAVHGGVFAACYWTGRWEDRMCEHQNSPVNVIVHGINLDHIHHTWEPNPITKLGVSIFIATYIVVYVVIGVPFLLFKMQTIRDAYNMATDTQWAMATGVPLFAFLWVNWLSTPWVHELHQMFPPLLWAVGSLFCIHTFSVTVPLIRSVHWARSHGGKRKQSGESIVTLADTILLYDINEPPTSPLPQVADSHRPTSVDDIDQMEDRPAPALPTLRRRYLKPPKFEDALANPHFYEQFRLHVQREFSSENLLFQAESQQFFRSFQFSMPRLSSADGGADSPMHKEALKVYERFVRPRAPCELNLPSVLRANIQECLATRLYDALLFEPARLHVFRLMKQDSYPRFVQSLSPLELEHFCLHCKPRPNSKVLSAPTIVEEEEYGAQVASTIQSLAYPITANQHRRQSSFQPSSTRNANRHLTSR